MEQLLITLVQAVVLAITIILFANMIVSFVLNPWHPLRQFISQLADPILKPFRRFIPPTGMLDFTPMIALIVVQFAGQILVMLIRSAF